MAERFRIAHVIASLDPRLGGPSEGIRQMCLAHRRLDHVATVVTLDAPQAAWLTQFDATVVALGPGRLFYRYCPQLLRWLRREHQDFDAVVVHGLWQFQTYATWRVLRRSASPYFVFTHGMLDPWFNRAHPLKYLKKLLYWALVERLALRDACAVLATTDEEARLARQSMPWSEWHAETVGFGIDAPEVDRAAAALAFRNQYPECHGKRNLLFLGRIHPKKGCDLLIEAFAHVAARDDQLHLIMAGPDAHGWRAELEERIEQLGLTRRVTWTGMLDGALKWGALVCAEAFVLTSHSENFGVAVVEALALGTPVLISHAVNIAPVITAAQAGLAEDDSEQGATRLLSRWIDLDAPARHAMAEAAQRCFDAQFHCDAATQRLVSTLKRLGETRARRPGFKPFALGTERS